METITRPARYSLAKRAIPPRAPLRYEGHAVDREHVDLAGLDLVGEHAERQGPRELRRLLLSLAVSQDAWKLRNLRNPATVSLLLELERQPHTRINYAIELTLKQIWLKLAVAHMTWNTYESAWPEPGCSWLPDPNGGVQIRMLSLMRAAEQATALP